MNPRTVWKNLRRPGLSVAGIAVLIIGILLLAACSNGQPGAPPGSPPPPTSSLLNAARAGSLAVGNPAPGFEIEVLGNQNYNKGDTLSLADLEGKAVVVNFWYPSCPPCREEMPYFESAFRENRDRGVEFVGIQLLGLDSLQDGQDFIEEYGISYAIGPDRDGGIVREYKVLGFPTTVFLDSEHKVVRTWTGALSKQQLDELVQQLVQ